ncbi:hypothetical protein [Chitinophaga rhizosphaerae]|uniref:hypothetical protein n=1 Tax=Chitinophaga rhizosphaerae TaxID=1864947 RepID=UPI000F810E50|nr:hypothetical protein [Chitinophaga rhizosphaerae]
MKQLIVLVLCIFAITACNREDDTVGNKLGLEALAVKKTDQKGHRKFPDEKLKELARNKEHINLTAADANKMFEKIKQHKPYNVDTMNLFKTAVYRFYSNVTVKGKKLIPGVKSGAEIGINEDLFQALGAGIDALNKDLSKKEKATENMTDSSIAAGIKAQLRNFPN